MTEGNRISVTVLDSVSSPFTLAFVGRAAWALRELMQARKRGCTSIGNPAPRWASYVHRLRRAGVEIETVHEPHHGAFPGTHARYILRSRVEVLPDKADGVE